MTGIGLFDFFFELISIFFCFLLFAELTVFDFRRSSVDDEEDVELASSAWATEFLAIFDITIISLGI